MEKEKAEVIYTSNDTVGIRIVRENNIEIVTLEVRKGGFIAEHRLPVDITFYVNDGLGELTVEDEKMIIEKGEKIFVQNGKMRKWINIGDGNLVIVGVKYFNE